MSSPIVTIQVGLAVRDAAEEMWNKRIGCLVVVDNEGKLAGVITERDIIYACAKDLLENKVESTMSTNVVTAQPEDRVATIVEKMRSHNVRHLPIVGADGKPVGVVSLRDVLDVAVGLLGLLTPPELG